MKKTCEGCRAIRWGSNGHPASCDRGYSQERGIPKEECPKPTTYKKLIDTPYKGKDTP